MTSELEQRLRAALHARTDLVTPEKLSPRPVPAAATGLARWVVPSLLAAAAAVVALVVGGVMVPQLTASPAPPATSPRVSVEPSPHPDPSGSTTVTTPPAPPTGSTAPTGSSGPTGQRTHQVRYRSVTLNLPPGWRLIPGDPRGDAEAACVLRPGAPTPELAADCPLTVQVMDDPTNFPTLVDADALGGTRGGTQRTCPDGQRAQLTAGQHTSERIDGRPAEFRTVIVHCAGGSALTIAQWVVTDRPNVVLVSRSRTGAGTPPADVAAIARGADLPAGDGKLTTDFGHLVGHKTTGGAVTLVFDRVTHGSIWGPTYDTGMPRDTNDNPATYDLRLAPDVQIRSGRLLCRKDAAGQYDGAGLGVTRCTVAELVAALDDPTSLARATPAWLAYDPQGRVAVIWEEFRA